MIQLVCEGLCNPMVETVDSEVQAFRESLPTTMLDGVVVAPPDDLIEKLHSLRHTRHFAIDSIIRSHFKCAECGTIRQFGDVMVEGIN